MRRAARIDENQPEIVKVLRQMGCTVQSLAAVGDGCPDILVGCPGSRYNILFEIKDGSKPPSDRKLTPDQVDWHNSWRGQVAVVKSVDEALDVVMQSKRI